MNVKFEIFFVVVKKRKRKKDRNFSNFTASQLILLLVTNQHSFIYDIIT